MEASGKYCIYSEGKPESLMLYYNNKAFFGEKERKK